MTLKFEALKLNEQKFLIADSYIHLIGEDAASFLNSQTTNNVKNLEIGTFHQNALLDITGKIISSFILCRYSETEFYLLTNKSFLDATLERVEKFHISEDFEVETKEQLFSISINSDTKSEYTGVFFGTNACIQIEQENIENPGNSFQKLKVLTGQPEFGVEVNPGELINNTRFDELCVDYKKGCYPGQETVSKIDSRRGASYKPVLLIIKPGSGMTSETNFLGKIHKDGKKIGEVLSSFYEEDSHYLYASINRENRIDASELIFSSTDEETLYKADVFYYPYFKLDDISIAVESYDVAMEYFLKEMNEEAVHYFKLAIEKDPKFEDAYESLGVLYGRLERYDIAIELMEELRALNENALMAYTNLSLYHMKIGNIETAEKFKAEATLVNFKTLGTAAQKKREEEAILKQRLLEMDKREGMFLQVLDIDAEDAMANNGMGEINFERNEFENSIKYFKAAISSDKKYSVAYLGQAKSLYQLERFVECREVLESGIAIASKNGDLMPANQMQVILLKI